VHDLQDQTTAHKFWILGHGVLLKMHVVTHTLLNKALPGIFGPPTMQHMLQGLVPYRAVMSAMYTDALVIAGLLAVTSAGIVHLVQ